MREPEVSGCLRIFGQFSKERQVKAFFWGENQSLFDVEFDSSFHTRFPRQHEDLFFGKKWVRGSPILILAAKGSAQSRYST